MFQMSPGVLVTEKDYTDIVPAVSSSVGATVGVFPWGPVMSPLLIDSETTLISRFGLPNDSNFQYFYTAANFLAYTDSLYVTRAETAGQKNAISMPSGGLSVTGTISGGSGYSTLPSVVIGPPDLVGGTQAVATLTSTKMVNTTNIVAGGTGYTVAPTIAFSAPVSGTTATGFVTVSGGVINSVTITNRGSGYTATPPTITITPTNGGSGGNITCTVTDGVAGVTFSNVGAGYSAVPNITLSGGAGTGAVIPWSITPVNTLSINNEEEYELNYINGAANVGTWAAKYPGSLGNSISVSMADSSNYTGWLYEDEFDGAPGTSTYAENHNAANCKDELHIIVIDTEGLWTGNKGGIMEKFAYVSKAGDAKKSDGSGNYYKDVINNGSRYIWWMDHPQTVTASNKATWGTTTLNITSSNPVFSDISPVDVTEFLSFGADDYNADSGDITAAFALYNDAEEYDISLIPVGPSPVTVAQYVIQNVAEIRKDCVAFVSPVNVTTSEPIIGNTFENFDDIVAYRADPATGINVSSSYAVMDTGYKYQYDRYNDKYRWVPLNGDVAGLCARTDWTNDPWWSPGGYNRGQIKGVIKLAVNPRKAYRDLLYKNGINPVVSFPGQGTVLFGDKTLLAKPSAFDRINVRRLFIVLEKAIATASKYQLFEFNDDFTRRKFVSMVEPFLRDVKGRRGVTDFLVKCDTQNNTPEIIDRNEFVADIYIKPNRVINFLYLNFIATRTGVDFEEVGG